MKPEKPATWSEQAFRSALARADAAEAALGEARRENEELREALREAFNVLDSTHATAYGRDVLPRDHGTVTYCYACEFAAKVGQFLGLDLNYDCPAAKP